MYNDKYAAAWIKDHESGADINRKNFIIPHLKKAIDETKNDGSILDVGCGWGIAIPLLKRKQMYTGVDITPQFFEYIQKMNRNTNVELIEGNLPNNLNLRPDKYDLVISSMCLHTVYELRDSINNLVSKVNQDGKLTIIDFNNSAKDSILERIEGKKKWDYCKGTFTLDSGCKVHAEAYFHGERKLEHELKKYGEFEKNYLGDLFVSYDVSFDLPKIG
jgi:2-polyprenyl-3-methyl-5-hydroxy-6-metoxy-1,4-benzoquinol methylase